MAAETQEKVFHPSTSWISRAGVYFEYTPEDTFKSLIENGLVGCDASDDDEEEIDPRECSFSLCSCFLSKFAHFDFFR